MTSGEQERFNLSLVTRHLSLFFDQLAQDVGKDAAVLIVIKLNRRINPEREGDFFRFTTGATNDESHILPLGL